MPDVVRALGEAGHPAVSADDFLPLPCSHPLCFSLAFYLLLENGEPISLTRIATAERLRDSVANRVFFGLDQDEHERLKAMVYDLWSGPMASVPDAPAVLATLRGILRDLSEAASGQHGAPFDARKVFAVGERRLKSVFVHAFQDAETFDLARVRRCCNAYPQADGRLMPACRHNVLGR